MSIQELRTSGLGEGHPEIWHANEISVEERKRRHGVVEMEWEGDLEAGQYTTIAFTIRAGTDGMETGGKLGINWRWPFDWADLQAVDPAGPGFVVASVAGDVPGSAPAAGSAGARAEFTIAYQRLGGIEPWHHLLTLELAAGRLHPGDVVRIVCGDRSHGGPGWRAPTCRQPRCGFMVLVDRTGDGRWIQLLDPPTFRVKPKEPIRMIAVADSEGVVGSPISLRVRGEDEWGNTSDSAASAGTLTVTTSPGPAGARIEADGADSGEDAFAVHTYRATFPEPGTYTLCVTSDRLGAVESNPIVVRSERPGLGVYWGDLHAGQTEMGCGSGTVEEHFRYGRDVAAVSFMSEQSNDHYVTTDDWREIRRVSDEMYVPGRFVAFLGCEWSPPTKDGGDRNVIYREDEPRLRRSGRYFTELEPDPEPDIPTAPEFHQAFRDEDVLVNIHVGGRRTNLEWYEPAIERLAEIHSTHGTIEWFIEDVLERGYRVAVTAGTDGVMSRPAADHPGWRLLRNLPSGLTGVLARELTREGLWEAFQARRTFATTGARMLISVDVDGHPMGSEFDMQGDPTVRIHVTGTTALERVDLLRGTTKIHSWQLAAPRPAGRDGASYMRVLWSGTGEIGTARYQRLDWDGSLQLENAEVADVQPIGFSSPLDTVRIERPDLVTWTSATAGSDAGLLLEVRDAGGAKLHFDSPVTSFSCSLSEIDDAPKVVDAGGFNRRVEVGRAPDASDARTVELTYRDEDAAVGWNPYWIRVVQVDRARGWSSPVYARNVASAEELRP